MEPVLANYLCNCITVIVFFFIIIIIIIIIGIFILLSRESDEALYELA